MQCVGLFSRSASHRSPLCLVVLQLLLLFLFPVLCRDEEYDSALLILTVSGICCVHLRAVVSFKVQFGWLSSFWMYIYLFQAGGYALGLVPPLLVCIVFIFVKSFISGPLPAASVYIVGTFSERRRGLGWFGTVNVGRFFCLWRSEGGNWDSCLLSKICRITVWLWWFLVLALRWPSSSSSENRACNVSGVD